MSYNPDRDTNVELCAEASWLQSMSGVSLWSNQTFTQTHTALCSIAFVYQRLSSDPTKQGLVCIMCPSTFHSFSFLTFFQMEIGQQMMHNVHLSQRQTEQLHFVVKAQTWARVNMVLYWLLVKRDFLMGSEIYVYSMKNMDKMNIDGKALCTAHPQ